MQEANFEVELVIADDCSTDQTGLIVNDFIEHHPRGNWIKYTKNAQNIGMMANFISAFEECKGEFIALCEGDDYWTDPFKLQKQVDFLENNLGVVLSYHEVKLLLPSGVLIDDNISEKSYWKSEASILDLALFGNFIHTPSVLFRNIINRFPEQFLKAEIGDFFLYVLLAEKGLLKKLPDCMAVYRLSTGSFSSKTFEKRWEAIRKTYQLIAKSTNVRFVAVILNLRSYQNKIYKAPFPKYFYKDQSIATIGKIIFCYLSLKNLFYALVKFLVEKTTGAKLSRMYFKLGK